MEKDYFPRGGAKETPVIQYKKFVFERKKAPKSHKKRKDEKTTNNFQNHRFNHSSGAKIYHNHLKYSDIGPGFQSICAVHSIFDDRLIVNLPYEMRAYILHSNISSQYSKTLKSKTDSVALSKMFYAGQLLSCKVIEKPSSDIGGKQNMLIYVTTDPAAVNWNLNSGMITERTMIQMAVSSVEDRGYMMESGIAGVMAFLPFEQAVKYAKTVLAHKEMLPIGTLLWCYVNKSNANSCGANFLEVRICHNVTFDLECMSPNILWPGSRVNTTITKVYDDGCCQVVVDGTDIHGTVNTQLDFNRDPSQVYFVGSGVKATVMTFSPFSDVYNFSFSHHVYKPLLTLDRAYKQICKATVDHVNKFVIYLTLKDKKFKGLIPVKSMLKKREQMLADDSKESLDPTDIGYKPGDFVKVEVANINFITRKYICSVISKLNPEQFHEGDEENNEEHEELSSDESFDLNYSFAIKEELESDVEMINDTVEIKEEEGIRSDQDDSGIETSKHSDSKSKKKKNKKNKKIKEEHANNSDTEIKDVPNSFMEIKKEEEYDNNRFLKVEKFENEELTRKRANESKENDRSKKLKTNKKDDRKPILSQTIKKKIDAAGQISLQQVDSQFIWDATPEDLAKVTSKDIEEFKEESDEESSAKKPLSKKQKKANEIEKERKIREKEDELLKALEEPKSADHYERLILSRPDDSKVWIKYMAFHLEATEVEKARAVGNRALKLITHRNEQDRLNIWLALLNLEHLYGSKELFKETWTEALKYNDDYKVNCKVLDMYAGSQNIIEVNSLVQRMVKQYKENLECWYACLSALMTASMEEKARSLLQRALKSLLAKNHVTLISRFALLENSHGFSEEAQALFDNLLTSYPARIDIWFVYIDMLIKSNQMDLTRQVFERATSLKLPAKKMKSLYKKWLEFEEKHGSEESVEMVRKSAVKYVEKATKEIGA